MSAATRPPSASARAVLPLLFGALLARLVVTGTYRRYVRASMRPWLVLAALGLLALAVWALLDHRVETAQDPLEPDHREHRSGTDGHEHRSGTGGHHRAHGDGGHDHAHDDQDDHHHAPHVPTIAWLLVLPALALFLVAPRGLGAFAAGRSGASAPNSHAGSGLAVLDPGGPARPMLMSEFVDRAWNDDGASLNGATVHLTGLVAPAKDGDGFVLLRFHISCCAADAVPAGVHITGWSGPTPATDSWLTADVRFRPGAPAVVYPPVEALHVTAVAPPGQPYEPTPNYG